MAKRIYKSKQGQKWSGVASTAGVLGAYAKLGRSASLVVKVMGRATGNLALKHGGEKAAQFYDAMAGKLDGARSYAKAKAYAYERGAMKRAKLNAAPVTAQGKQQKAMRVASGWVKPHNATSAKGKTYFVKGHFRKSA